MGPHIRGILSGLQKHEAQRLPKRSFLCDMVVMSTETCDGLLCSALLPFLDCPGLSVHPPNYSAVQLPTHLSTQQSTHAPTDTPVYLALHPSTRAYIPLFTHQCIYPPIYIPIHPHVPIHLPDCSSTHPCTESSPREPSSCLLSLQQIPFLRVSWSPHLQDVRKT